MAPFDKESFVAQAERLYQDRLLPQLAQVKPGTFVAIEPQSERYFLGRTLSEAMRNASDELPGRLFHVVRFGQQTAVHIG